MWRCASASRRERATVYELRIHHAALVIGRSIEPRARRAPGAVPGPFRPAARRISAIAVINTIAVRIMRVRSGYPGRAPAPIGELGRTVLIHAAPPHPTRQAHGRHGPRGGVTADRRPPQCPPLYDFSLLGDGVRRRPTLPVPRCDTGHPAQRAQGARTRLQLWGAHSRPFIFPPAPPHSRDARATITHSGHTFTLDPALKPVSHPPETLSLALNSIHSASHTHSHASTHSHSLTQTHPLTHSHASTHSHSLEVRIDAHLTGSR